MARSGRLFSIRRLRWAIAVAAVLLVLVLAGYIGYARYRVHRFLAGLPAKLGVNITQETDHVSYSQTYKGRTVFTLHAAKQIQRKDGKVTLRDVGIVLYGRKGDRADRIHGEEFEYDQKNGVVSAAGEVFLDLAPPTRSGTNGGEDDLRLIHVKTSGLVFRQKEETATTENALEFRSGGMTGTALGATYDSGKGMMVLQSQVRVSGLRGSAGAGGGGERPMVLTAGHAEFDRNGDVATLVEARVVSASETGTQTAAAQHAVVHVKPDGTPQRVDADGRVTLTGEGRGTVTAERLQLELNAAGQPSAAHLVGLVRFSNDQETRQEHGRANEARMAFDGQGRPVHAWMDGNVEADLTAGQSTRWLGADKLELALGGGGKERVQLRGARASAAGGAHMRLVDSSRQKDAKGRTTSDILRTNVTADVLSARMLAKGGQQVVTGVDGAGRTMVERTLTPAGAGSSGTPQWRESATGDTLKMDFRQTANARGKTMQERTELVRAEQQGSVRIVREAQAKPDAKVKPGGATMEVEHAEGDDAVYDADADRMSLTGAVKVTDAENALFADRVQMDRASGDATAEGAVRVSYLEPGSTGEPVHVLAARAVAHKGTGVTQFSGGRGGDVRMWQGGSQVEAPLLDLDRTRRTLLAHAENGGAAQVKTVLADAGGGSRAMPGAAQKTQTHTPVRVVSRELLYTDATRQVAFRGQVQVNDADGTMRSQEATIFLAPSNAGPTKTPGAAISLDGRVDHMIASGAVEVAQPGRRATGDRLVYTAAEHKFVLTGTKAAPPGILDETQGSVTGAELRFTTGDDSVEVLSGVGSERVHTETRMKQKN